MNVYNLDKGYDASYPFMKFLRACGWGHMLNWGYYRFYDLLFHPFRLDIPQERLASKSISLLSVKDDNNILDIGCGRGKSSFMISMRHPSTKITGVDYLTNNINIAKGVFGNIANLSFQQGNAMSTSFDNNTFDRIHCLEAAHHFDREKFIEEAYRILKPGGKLVIVDFAWINDKSRKLNSSTDFELVKDMWQYEDFSSIEEYRTFFKNSGFTIEKDYDWTNQVLNAAQRRSNMFSKAYSSQLFRYLLLKVHKNLIHFNSKDWNNIIKAIKAHNSIRKHIKYMAFIVQKPF